MKIASRMKKFGVAALAATAVLAACSDSGTGPNPGLRPEQVASLYTICSLEFQPAGTVLPPVNIAAAAFEFPGGIRNPLVGLDPDAARTVELVYVPKGLVNTREVRGTYRLRGDDTVEIRFNTSGVDPKPLLLPDNVSLQFRFEDSPPRLSIESATPYSVTRQAYVGLSGHDPEGIAESIPGSLRAHFSSVGCG